MAPTGDVLAVGTADGAISLWDITDRAEHRQIGTDLIGPQASIFWLAFNDDGDQVAAATDDGSVSIWDVTSPENPELYAHLVVPDDALHAMTFVPGRDLLAAAGYDLAAYLWHSNVEDAARMICTVAGDQITEQEWRAYIPDRDYSPAVRLMPSIW